MLKINYETIKEYYLSGHWSADAVREAAKKGYITYDEAQEIIDSK